MGTKHDELREAVARAMLNAKYPFHTNGALAVTWELEGAELMGMADAAIRVVLMGIRVPTTDMIIAGLDVNGERHSADIWQAMIDKLLEGFNGPAPAAEEARTFTADELTAYGDAVMRGEREACCQAIRMACPMCDRGHPHDGDPGGEEECEYCGRPIAAIRARDGLDSGAGGG